MKRIPLTQGKFALVDDEDFEYLNQWKWFAQKDHNTFYAGRQIRLENGKQKTIQMHNFLMKTPKGMKTDHKDHNGLNNQRCNLRICTDQQNQANQRHGRGKDSKHKGVSKHRLVDKWEAHIGFNYKQIYLGLFKTEELAALAYNEAAKELHKEFASFNIVKPILIKRKDYEVRA